LTPREVQPNAPSLIGVDPVVGERLDLLPRYQRIETLQHIAPATLLVRRKGAIVPLHAGLQRGFREI